jgi:prepilin-type N-terminal cleavage/methylation domain-containing protein
MRDATLTAVPVRERGLLNQPGMELRRRPASVFTRARSARGFSLIELLMVVAIIAVMGGIAMGVTHNMVRTAKGKSGAQQLASFLKRQREMSISRRRNIQITFTAPNIIASVQRGVPDPPNATVDTPLETMRLEGQIQYHKFTAITVDTPDGFGSGANINLGGTGPYMFTSEGSFVDVNGDPINATILLGIPNQRPTANALTIIGTTSAVRTWRFDGSRWVQ